MYHDRLVEFDCNLDLCSKRIFLFFYCISLERNMVGQMKEVETALANTDDFWIAKQFSVSFFIEHLSFTLHRSVFQYKLRCIYRMQAYNSKHSIIPFFGFAIRKSDSLLGCFDSGSDIYHPDVRIFCAFHYIFAISIIITEVHVRVNVYVFRSIHKINFSRTMLPPAFCSTSPLQLSFLQFLEGLV